MSKRFTKMNLQQFLTLLEELNCSEEAELLQKEYACESWNIEVIEVEIDYDDNKPGCICEFNIYTPHTVYFGEPNTNDGGFTIHWAKRNPDTDHSTFKKEQND